MSEHTFNWKCASCGRPTTVTEPNFADGVMSIAADETPREKGVRVFGRLIECPNPECGAQHFTVRVTHGNWQQNGGWKTVSGPFQPVGIGSFTFLPETASPLSPHVPEFIAADYREAYLIRNLSPKASATLSRRALQGMIRHFWGEVHPTLHLELQAIKDKCDHDLFTAMMGIKSVGNIGAHPEKDINLIVDIEPGEPEALLDLLLVLDEEWYVAKAEKEARIARVKALSAAKKDAQASATPAGE